METAPKSLRIQLAITGRINVGKSSLVNLICGQSVAISSPKRGTTTDVVEKAMELRPLGPVLWLDTAGLDDDSTLGTLRRERTQRALDRADIIILVTTPNIWGKEEEEIIEIAKQRKVGLIVIINKCDLFIPNKSFINVVREKSGITPLCINTKVNDVQRKQFLTTLTSLISEKLSADIVTPPPLLEDLISFGDNLILITPIDLQAPKGRLIMPQMQCIRSGLDAGARVLVVKENQYLSVLSDLTTPPALVVCDSQVVDYMVKETDPDIPCTTFSILFSRLKGDMESLATGAAQIEKLQIGDKILVAEACTHHPSNDDIGRIKIPALLRKKVGGNLDISVVSGLDFPPNINEYKLIVHCGGCMLNRREMLRRLEIAKSANIPITNYGMAISACNGVLERVLSPFPFALSAWKEKLKS